MTWDALPLTLNAKELAPLLRVSVGTVHRRCARRRMVPAPITYATTRYLWSRDVVRAWVERGLHEQPQPRKRLISSLQVPPMATAADVKAVAASLLKGA